MNYFYNRELYNRPPQQYMPPYNAYAATTFDFQNPSTANIQQVLKESWPLFGAVGAVSILLGVTKLIPWADPTISYIIGGTLLAGAGYGFMQSKNP